jgi:hypothetical protein
LRKEKLFLLGESQTVDEHRLKKTVQKHPAPRMLEI